MGSDDIRCAYCKEKFAEGEIASECCRCGAFHHYDCFCEFHRCAVFGCGSPFMRTAIPGLGTLKSTEWDGESTIYGWRWVA